MSLFVKLLWNIDVIGGLFDLQYFNQWHREEEEEKEEKEEARSAISGDSG